MPEKFMAPKFTREEPAEKQEELKRTGAVRVKSGIPGLDEVLEGGMPERHVILLTGGPGCGKTIFGMQFAARGAKENGGKALFVSFEQPREELVEQCLQFGWDIQGLEAKGALKIISFAGTSLHIARIWDAVEKEISAFKPDRLVVDSLSSLTVHLDLMTGVEILELLGVDTKQAGFVPTGDAVTRKTLMELFKRLKALRLTSLLITELPENGAGLSRDGVSEFLADGVIILRYSPESVDSFSTLQVRKMRGIRHMRAAFATELSEDGGASVQVKPK